MVDEVLEHLPDVLLHERLDGVAQAQVLEVVLLADLEDAPPDHVRPVHLGQEARVAQVSQVLQHGVGRDADALRLQVVADPLGGDDAADAVCHEPHEPFQEVDVADAVAGDDVLEQDDVVEVAEVLVDDPVRQLQIDQMGKAAVAQVAAQRLVALVETMECRGTLRKTGRAPALRRRGRPAGWRCRRTASRRCCRCNRCRTASPPRGCAARATSSRSPAPRRPGCSRAEPNRVASS